VLSRRAALLAGGLAIYLQPKLATDAKIDLPDFLKGVSSKNYKAEAPKVVAAITQALDGKLAKDATLADIGKQMDAMAAVPMEEGADADPNSGLPMSAEELKKQTMDEAETKKMDFLKSKLSAEDMKAYDTMCGNPAEDETPEEKAAREAKAADADPDKKPEMVSKSAMDAALKAVETTATANAVKATIAAQNALRDAEKDVRPYVGDLAMAHDSAEAVYRTALGTLPGVKLAADELKSLPLAALKAVLKSQPIPGQRKAETTPLAMDAAAADSYNKMFPNAARILHS
jgi:hypothetical protein